jgi:hypothetical protein
MARPAPASFPPSLEYWPVSMRERRFKVPRPAAGIAPRFDAAEMRRAHDGLPPPPSLLEESILSLGERLFETRGLSIELAAPLSAEDMTVQAMDDASPTKWHLAHTTWFFETFVLARYLDNYELFDETFNYCFNSYYEHQGPRQPRPKRGLLTRPSIDRVLDYRAHVDHALEKLVGNDAELRPELSRLIEIGVNHEQQHQELMLTDILALFAANPLRPAYRAARPRAIRTGTKFVT